MALSRNHIFECSFDDEMFSNLPNLFINEFSARSMIMHFVTKDGQHNIAADSGYWPRMQLENYSRQFVDKDILLKARLLPENINRICNVTEDLISRDEFLNSEIYNDHYKVYNDDLAHAIGGCFETKRGRVAIGLHRGRGAKAFSKEDVEKLGILSNDLTNMLIVRSESNIQKQNNNILNQIIDKADIAFIHIDENFKIINSNQKGLEKILAENGISFSSGRLITSSRNGIQLIDGISRAMFNRLPRTINMQNRETNIEVKVKPIYSQSGNIQALIIIEGSARPNSEIIQILERRYLLTNIEAKIALMVADGKTIDEISNIRNVSPNTVKSQRKAIYNKTGCTKLSKLTLLISSLRS